MCFCVYNSPPKRTKNVCPSRLARAKIWIFRFVFLENRTLKRRFEINWPLAFTLCGGKGGELLLLFWKLKSGEKEGEFYWNFFSLNFFEYLIRRRIIFVCKRRTIISVLFFFWTVLIFELTSRIKRVLALLPKITFFAFFSLFWLQWKIWAWYAFDIELWLKKKRDIVHGLKK